MPDVRDLLRCGTDELTTGLPDVDALWRRSRAIRARRVLAVAAVVLSTAAAVGVDVDGTWPDQREVTTLPPTAVLLPDAPAPLEHGTTYSAQVAGLPYSFTIPGPGWLLAAREDGWLSLHHGRTRVNLQRWTAIYDPQADPAQPSDRHPVPADLLAWVRSNTRLDVRAEKPVALAGSDWLAVDLTVSRPLSVTPGECAGQPCALLAAAGDEEVELLATELLVCTSHAMPRGPSPAHCRTDPTATR
ncbi:MAG: hypothetical protein WKF54_06010 [Nocardioidaceae bacterium]